jgi:hypothetical protein
VHDALPGVVRDESIDEVLDEGKCGIGGWKLGKI